MLRIEFNSPHLANDSFFRAAKEFFIQSRAPETSEIEFDLSGMLGFEIFEAALLVAWISRCTRSGKSVKINFPPCHPLASPHTILRVAGDEQAHHFEDIMQLIKNTSGPAAQTRIQTRLVGIEDRIQADVRGSKPLNYVRDQILTAQDQLGTKIPRSLNLINALFEHLNWEIAGMRVIGFASRMGILETIQSLGCKVLPLNWSTLAWPYAYDPEITGTIPLKLITTGRDLAAATAHLSSDLERIFGEYASVDVIRGGALSNVIVHELGANILQHAGSGCGFLLTRIVRGASRKHFVREVVGEQTPMFFRGGGVAESGFLELVVCDDGIGIPDSLRDDLKRTLRRRADLGTRFKPDRDEDVIAFAFDRLSSSKRTSVDLLGEAYQALPLFNGRIGGVASGLFWVWNLMRTYQGFIRVRSGSCELAYDFSEVDAAGQPRAYVASEPFVGTQLGIYLPLTKQDKRELSVGLRRSVGLGGESEAVALGHPIMPVGDGLGS